MELDWTDACVEKDVDRLGLLWEHVLGRDLWRMWLNKTASLFTWEMSLKTWCVCVSLVGYNILILTRSVPVSHCPDLHQAAPEASWVGWYLEVRPHLLPNQDVLWGIAVSDSPSFLWHCYSRYIKRSPVAQYVEGRMPAEDNLTSVKLCYDDTLMSAPVTLPASVW